MSNSHKVFVYGTLKRNEPNHHTLTNETNGDAKFLGAASTVEKYPLVIASRYNIPYVLDAKGQGKNVFGEVYEVDDAMLNALDMLEDHPKYYERKMEKVKLLDSEATLEAWIYLLHNFKPNMLTLPFFSSYEGDGDHGLRYIARYLRPNPGPEYWSDVKEEKYIY